METVEGNKSKKGNIAPALSFNGTYLGSIADKFVIAWV